VPAPPDRRTPLSAAALSLVRPPSLARCLVGPTCRRQFLHPRASPLCLVGLVRQLLSRCPEPPFPLSLCAVDPSCQICPPRARRGSMSAHSRTSPDFSATTSAHAPSSLIRAPHLPPLPHFAQLCPLSHSALAARRHWRPAPAFPTIQLAGDRAKPPRAPPRGETPLLVLNFPSFALCLANFSITGARPRRSAVLAWWPADLARSSSPE
jgi:hypothetical protein